MFLFRESYNKSLAAAVSRMAATLVSFALCLAYLAVLPFSPWGLAIMVGLSVLVTARRISSDRGLGTASSRSVDLSRGHAASPRERRSRPISSGCTTSRRATCAPGKS